MRQLISVLLSYLIIIETHRRGISNFKFWSSDDLALVGQIVQKKMLHLYILQYNNYNIMYSK